MNVRNNYDQLYWYFSLSSGLERHGTWPYMAAVIVIGYQYQRTKVLFTAHNVGDALKRTAFTEQVVS